MSEINDLMDFRTRFNMKTHQTPTFDLEMLKERIIYLNEEMCELLKAIDDEDLSEVGDALVDLVYIAKGSALALGMNWDRMWAEVHRSNMSKEVARTPEQSKRGIVGDVYKPDGWTGPDIATAMQWEPKMSVLEEAFHIIEGRDQETDRRYGDMEDNLKDAAQVAAIISGYNLRPRDILASLIGLKLARHRHYYKRDNLLDAIAYMGALDNHLSRGERNE